VNATTSFRLLQVALVLLSCLLAISGTFLVIILIQGEPFKEEARGTMDLFFNFGLIGSIIGIPSLILVIIKRRKSELTSPTEFTKLYFRRREPHQCTICQKHPTSKNYHIKNVHNMKDVKVDDYFRDCGCDKCARYDKSDAG